MIEEQAIVLSVEKEEATLEIMRSKPCGICGKTRGCGVSLWGRIFGHEASVFKAANKINAKAGDAVVVGIDEQAVILSALAVYGIPLVTMFIGGFLAGVFAPSELHADRNAVIGAVLGLLAGGAWLKGHLQGRRMDARFHPVILRLGKEVVVNFKC
ncbi:MAG TPA: SoxR reducing system RseC family protein [Methylophilaceae bacterium]|jgi:sigma-E factor negative regulatory protein RseC